MPAKFVLFLSLSFDVDTAIFCRFLEYFIRLLGALRQLWFQWSDDHFPKTLNVGQFSVVSGVFMRSMDVVGGREYLSLLKLGRSHEKVSFSSDELES